MKTKKRGFGEEPNKILQSIGEQLYRMRYLGVLGVMALLLPSPAVAQVDKVSGAIGNVVGQMGGLASNVIQLVKIVIGILAVVALISLVVKFQEGDHEAKKRTTMWLGGLVITFVALTIIQQLFGLG